MINTRKKSHFYGALIIEHDKNSANAAHVLTVKLMVIPKQNNIPSPQNN